MSKVVTTTRKLEEVGLKPLGKGSRISERPRPPMRHVELFQGIVDWSKAQVICENGSWEGASAITWANAACRIHDGQAAVICIDTWLGSLEMLFDPSGSEWGRSRLFYQDGYPDVFTTFKDNIRDAGLGDVVTAVPFDSHQGLELLKRLAIAPDVLYVDAGHDFSQVYRDLKSCFELNVLSGGQGLICGDDYSDSWPGVKLAADTIALRYGCDLLVRDAQFIFVGVQHEGLGSHLQSLGWVRALPSRSDI